jgi:hypothetical protein
VKQGEATSPPDFAYIFGNNITLSGKNKGETYQPLFSLKVSGFPEAPLYIFG